MNRSFFKQFPFLKALTLSLLLLLIFALPVSWGLGLFEKALPSKASIDPEEGLLEELGSQLYQLSEQNKSLVEVNQHLQALVELKGDEKEKALFESLRLGMPAKVIFRDQSAWAESFWIHLGGANSQVVLDSPVIIGDHLVGVIDHVGKYKSRVRLLSHPELHISTRVLRKATNTKEDRYDYGPKGMLKGGVKPNWRGRAVLLEGSGFNYAYSDSRGEGRGLKSLQIDEGDLLVTTGMDGIFPEGLKVAQVIYVYPLEEGAAHYRIEAKAIYDLDSLIKTVWVLPPEDYTQVEL